MIFSVEKNLENVLFREYKEITDGFIKHFSKTGTNFFPIFFVTNEEDKYQYKLRNKEIECKGYALPFCNREIIEPEKLDLYTWKQSVHIQLCLCMENNVSINLSNEIRQPKKIFVYGTGLNEDLKNYLLTYTYFKDQRITQNDIPTFVNSTYLIDLLRKEDNI
ncbi:MAG: hypothetical protein PHT94_00400 [Candidatus Nanoarchaeia archaeon]|nr:hypothetical protein [Candidatus Nanoarchaeia archaeon]